MDKKDYILTSKELSENYNFDIKQYLIDASNDAQVLQEAYDILITAILDNNDDLVGESDVLEFIGSDAQKISAFKKAQARIIKNLFYLGADEKPTKDLMPILNGDLKIVKINGFQKRIFKKND